MNQWKAIINSSTAPYNEKLQSIYTVISNHINSTNDYGLFGGKTGILIFLYYYYKKTQDESALKLINNLIAEIIYYFNNRNTFLTFSNGLAGYVWTIKFLITQEFLDIEENNFFNDIEPFLKGYVKDEIDKGNYDYMHGGLGPLLYFAKASKQDFCYDIFKKLNDKSIRDDHNKRKWYYYKDNKLNDYIVNFGLSHGLAGIMAIHSKLYEKDPLCEIYKENIIQIFNYLCFHQQDVVKYKSYFPYLLDEKIMNYHFCRLAWCYGDLGIGYTFLKTGKIIKDEALIRKGKEILIDCSKRRDFSEYLIYDSGFCHGTAGNAHIFNKAYQLCGIEAYREAAIYWYNHIFTFSNYSEGLAGFRFCRYPKANDYYDSLGILEGIAGVGLCIIAATSEIEPEWDEIFLL